MLKHASIVVSLLPHKAVWRASFFPTCKHILVLQHNDCFMVVSLSSPVEKQLPYMSVRTKLRLWEELLPDAPERSHSQQWDGPEVTVTLIWLPKSNHFSLERKRTFEPNFKKLPSRYFWMWWTAGPPKVEMPPAIRLCVQASRTHLTSSFFSFLTLFFPFFLYLESCVTSASSLIKRYGVCLSLSFSSSSKVLTSGRH